jgi:hypothetical protein
MFILVLAYSSCHLDSLSHQAFPTRTEIDLATIVVPRSFKPTIAEPLRSSPKQRELPGAAMRRIRWLT